MYFASFKDGGLDQFFELGLQMPPHHPSFTMCSASLQNWYQWGECIVTRSQMVAFWMMRTRLACSACAALLGHVGTLALDRAE
ncbi:MAG: hypothetical protein AAFW75_07845 [Cyanobacteria bacterium J06636_16]